MTDYAAALIEQNRLVCDVIRYADLATPVPTCPGWTLEQLLRHVGRGHRWAAQIVRDKRDSPLHPREVPGGKPPADTDGALEWLDASARTIVDAVQAVGAETPVWTFCGPRPAGWWIRRRLHEATVHRADAAIALGVDYDLAPELAADGMSEWLDLVAANVTGDQPASLDVGVSLHLHATDAEAEWTLRGTDAGVVWESAHVTSTAAARGRAVDLFLTLLRRRSAEDVGVEIVGEAKVWTTWLDRTPF